jgi:LmbE family N-acetylglucosaminyl deacetylase
MKVLIIGAHPDDETYGMGGTIAKYTSRGIVVHVLIITDGSSSQYNNYKEMIMRKKKEAKNAMEILGVEKIELESFPDMKLDTIPHIEINKLIENKIKNFNPSIIFTHHWGDINKDHRLVFESTIVATRPINNQTLKSIYTYETPSSTEWSSMELNDKFVPNLFIDISEFMDQKIKAIEAYESELRKFPHPRSTEAVRAYDKKNGIIIGRTFAERFTLIRSIQ